MTSTSWDAVKAGDVCGSWVLTVSRSTGKQYWWHDALREAAWHDASLPRGWAWQIAGTDAPKLYVNLPRSMATVSRQAAVPAQPASAVDASTGSPRADPRPFKRPRMADSSGVVSIPHPRMSASDMILSRPEDKPPVPTRGSAECAEPVPHTGGSCASGSDIPSPFFADAHKLLLRQVLKSTFDALNASVAAHKKSGVYDEWTTVSLIAFDLGAGTGAVTQYLLKVIPDGAGVVYSVESGFPAYYAATLRAYGHDDVAAAYERDVPDPWSQLLLNVWDDVAVTPMRFPVRAALSRLKHIDVKPHVVYMDAELQYAEVKAALEYILKEFPLAHVVGGGWDLSPDLQRAVTDVSSAAGRALHVEQGRAWTLSGQLIAVTANDSVSISAEGAVLAQAMNATTAQVEQAAARREWFNAVNEVLERGDNVIDLNAAVGPHGAGAEDPAHRWIDMCGEDKRHLTLLMHAAQKKRNACVQALVDVHGANVNVQAERSAFTALGLAAYAGAHDIVTFLLARGADPSLVNKYGEDAVKNAQQRGHTVIAAALQSAVAARASGVVAK